MGYYTENRIKELRKALSLTQQEFADRLNIKRGAVANYEIGRNTPIDAVISLICREFNVNEEWLRNGEGDMFTQTTPYEKAYNRFGYIMENSSPSKKAALTMLLEILYSVPDDRWDAIMRQFEESKKEG